jgi:hypothetical protein
VAHVNPSIHSFIHALCVPLPHALQATSRMWSTMSRPCSVYWTRGRPTWSRWVCVLGWGERGERGQRGGGGGGGSEERVEAGWGGGAGVGRLVLCVREEGGEGLGRGRSWCCQCLFPAAGVSWHKGWLEQSGLDRGEPGQAGSSHCTWYAVCLGGCCSQSCIQSTTVSLAHPADACCVCCGLAMNSSMHDVYSVAGVQARGWCHTESRHITLIWCHIMLLARIMTHLSHRVCCVYRHCLTPVSLCVLPPTGGGAAAACDGE